MLSTFGGDGGEPDFHEVRSTSLGEEEVELEVGCVVLDSEACAKPLRGSVTIEDDAVGRGRESKDIAHLMMLRPALSIVRADEG